MHFTLRDWGGGQTQLSAIRQADFGIIFRTSGYQLFGPYLVRSDRQKNLDQNVYYLSPFHGEHPDNVMVVIKDLCLLHLYSR